MTQRSSLCSHTLLKLWKDSPPSVPSGTSPESPKEGVASLRLTGMTSKGPTKEGPEHTCLNLTSGLGSVH